MMRKLLLIPLACLLAACGTPDATTTPSTGTKVSPAQTRASQAQTNPAKTSTAPATKANNTGGSITCKEFAALNAKTGLTTNPNAKQVSLIKQILVEYNKDPGEHNVMALYTGLIAWCNIYDGVSSAPNTNEQIKNVPGLRG